MAKILIVDDEDPIRDMMLNFFEYSGHQATVCSKGETAVSLAEDGNVYNVVILDFNIGGGYDGGTLRKALSELLPEGTTYFLVASEDKIPDGFKTFFPKPVLMPELIKAVVEALEYK